MQFSILIDCNWVETIKDAACIIESVNKNLCPHTCGSCSNPSTTSLPSTVSIEPPYIPKNDTTFAPSNRTPSKVRITPFPSRAASGKPSDNKDEHSRSTNQPSQVGISKVASLVPSNKINLVPPSDQLSIPRMRLRADFHRECYLITMILTVDQLINRLKRLQERIYLKYHLIMLKLQVGHLKGRRKWSFY